MGNLNNSQGPLSSDEWQDIPVSRQETTDTHDFSLLEDGQYLTDYPFFAGIEQYLQTACALLQSSTISERRRKLRHVGRIFEELRGSDPEITTDPKNMEQKDMTAFINWMRENRLDPATQRKYLQMLGHYMIYNGNGTLVQMKMVHKNSWPKAIRKPNRTLTLDEITKLINSAEELSGWWGDVARLVTVIYPVTGLRPTELRKAQLVDLDVKNLIIKVSNPKGAGVYGRQRMVQMDEIYRDTIENFLDAREEYLAPHGLSSKILIPRVYPSGIVDVWSQGLWSKLKLQLQKKSGVMFSWKDYRSTCASIDINFYDYKIEDVSVKLGHSTTSTTELFYSRIEMGKAQERMAERFIEAKRSGRVAIYPRFQGKVKSQSGPKEI